MIIDNGDGTFSIKATGSFEVKPQFKELTDEEIISEWISCDRNYYNFAKAILKKASEK